MLKINYTVQFNRDLKLITRQKKDLMHLQKIMKVISEQKQLDKKYKDHILRGNWKNHRELHLAPDWLLIYKLDLNDNSVTFVRTGSHSDLFE